jgi:hypothetical protein
MGDCCEETHLFENVSTTDMVRVYKDAAKGGIYTDKEADSYADSYINL